jgi:hypothetical protein
MRGLCGFLRVLGGFNEGFLWILKSVLRWCHLAEISSNFFESSSHLAACSSHVAESSGHEAKSSGIKQVLYGFLEGFSSKTSKN